MGANTKVNLARKYRPRELKDVIGQEMVSKTIQEALRTDKIAPAYLFSGPRGTGKTTCARIFARAAACLAKNSTERPCDKCASCEAYNKNQSMDLIEIDGASHTGVDDVRKIIDAVAYRPNISARTVYIIDEVHMLSNAAFNALLKTLEEPPSHLLFLFATTEPEKIPSTILSRVQRMELKRLSVPQIVHSLSKICEQEGIKSSKDILERIATAADGSLRDSQTFLDQLVTLSGSQELSSEIVETFLGTIGVEAELQILAAVAKRDVDSLLTKVAAYYEQGKDLVSILQRLVHWTRSALILRAAPKTTVLQKEISNDEATALSQMFKDWSVVELDHLFEILWHGFERAHQSEWPRLSLETTLIRACQPPVTHVATSVVSPSAPQVAQPVVPKPSYSPPPRATPRPQAPSQMAHAPMPNPATSLDEILAELKKRRPSAHALIICAEGRAFENGQLVLTYSPGHFATKQLNEKILRKEIEDLLSLISGGRCKTIELKERAKSASTGTAAAKPATAGGRNFMADARKAIVADPAIQKASQLLGAEIESVTIEGIKSS